MTGAGVPAGDALDADGVTEADADASFILLVGVESGFPSERSPIFGTSRNSGVQYCHKERDKISSVRI